MWALDGCLFQELGGLRERSWLLGLLDLLEGHLLLLDLLEGLLLLRILRAFHHGDLLRNLRLLHWVAGGLTLGAVQLLVARAVAM